MDIYDFMKTIVLGPPGTGKTTTLLKEVDKHLKQTYRSGASVLYIGCSERGNITGQNETI